MFETHGSPAPYPGTWLPTLLVTLAVAIPSGGAAQADAARGWTVTPMLGFGVVHDGDWRSAGMEAALELGYGGDAWRLTGHGSQQGLGVTCSHACWGGGPAFAVGGARSVGSFWLGAGVGLMRQFGEWRPAPWAGVSFDTEPFRIDMRVEFPEADGARIYLPVLLGYPIPIRP